MQDAEIDERARKHEPAPDARRERARGDDADAPPEMRGVAPARSASTRLTPTSSMNDADDQRAKAEPERIVLEVGGDDAVEAQVEAEVVDEHQAQRAAAQRVDRRRCARAPAAVARMSSAAAAGRGARALARDVGSSRPHAAVRRVQPPASGAPIAASDARCAVVGAARRQRQRSSGVAVARERQCRGRRGRRPRSSIGPASRSPAAASFAVTLPRSTRQRRRSERARRASRARVAAERDAASSRATRW